MKKSLDARGCYEDPRFAGTVRRVSSPSHYPALSARSAAIMLAIVGAVLVVAALMVAVAFLIVRYR